MPKIRGKVIERYTKQPVAGAIINVGNNSTYTDKNGFFEVDTSMGQVVLQVTHRDFQPYAESLVINRPLTQTEIMLDSIIRAL